MFAKIEEFTVEQQEIAQFTRLLSHPARVAIMEFLAAQTTCISGEITDAIPLSRTTVSQHLQELKSAGLIKGEVEGKNVCYCIDKTKWNAYMKRMQGFLDMVNRSNVICC